MFEQNRKMFPRSKVNDAYSWNRTMKSVSSLIRLVIPVQTRLANNQILKLI